MRLYDIAGLALCLLCAAPAGAADTAASEPLQPALTVQTSGQILPEYTILIGRNSAQTPLTAPVYEKNGVLMVPLRPVAEQLGYTVAWDEEKQCAFIETNTVYMHLYPGVDMYERIGSLKTVNLNHIYQYGIGPENVEGMLYVPAKLFEAFFNDVFIEEGSLVIAPQEVYLHRAP